jgi:hypothetical protein
MNLCSIVVVVLRLMALDFLLRVAIQLAPSLLTLARLSLSSATGQPALDTALPWLLLIGFVICAILLWILALPIARLVTKGVPQDVSLGGLTLTDCYSLAFLGVGLFYMGSGLPQVLSWGHYLFKMAASSSGDAWKEQVNLYQVWQAVIPFILGVVIFVKGRAWAVALASRQQKQESLNPSLDPTAAAGGSRGKADTTGGGSRGSA